MPIVRMACACRFFRLKCGSFVFNLSLVAFGLGSCLAFSGNQGKRWPSQSLNVSILLKWEHSPLSLGFNLHLDLIDPIFPSRPSWKKWPENSPMLIKLPRPIKGGPLTLHHYSLTSPSWTRDEPEVSGGGRVLKIKAAEQASSLSIWLSIWNPRESRDSVWAVHF